MSHLRYKAIFGYDDPENENPETRTIAIGDDVEQVSAVARSVYGTFLADKIGVGRVVAGRHGETHRLAALDAIRVAVIDMGEFEDDNRRKLVWKVGGNCDVV